MKRIGIFLFFLFTTASLHAQWLPTFGPSGGQISGLATIGTSVFAGNSYGVSEWAGDTQWVTFGTTSDGIDALLTNGNNLYAAGLGGVLFSNNLDTSWAPLFNGQYFTAIAISGSNLIASDNDNGILLTQNNGGYWAKTNYDSTNPAYALATIGSTVLAGAIGVSRSTDNGATWNFLDNALDTILIYSFGVSGTNVFAGTYNNGVYFSSDNGSSWTPVNNGLTNDTEFGVNAIGIIGDKIFAGTDSGVFLSTNNGAHWIAVDDSLPSSIPVYSFASDSTYLYIGTDIGVYRRPLTEFNGVNDAVNTVSETTALTVNPNPMTTSTTIRFTSSGNTSVRISIVSLLGTEVARVFDGEAGAGGKELLWDASSLPSGNYWCVMQNGTERSAPVALVKQ